MNNLHSSLQAAIVGQSIDEATFSVPWMARAFAITLALSRAAHFTLEEFQKALIENIKASEDRGEAIISEEDYYTCWINALTELLQRNTPITSLSLSAAERHVQEKHRRLQHDHHHSHDITTAKPVFREPALCK